MNVTIVTVTYGKRSQFLIQALDAAKAQGAAEAVVIDNGSEEPITDILAVRYGGWAIVHSLGSNRGSAVGFKTGIEQALLRSAAYILLLDDDNVLGTGCIEILRAAYVNEWLNTDPAYLIGFCFRADRHQWIVDRACGRGAPRRNSSFRGFHIFDSVAKIRKRFGERPIGGIVYSEIPKTIIVEAAAYGGMFFHKSLVETIGLPDEKFFLYEDDIEYTSRLIAKGGKTILVTGAKIFDCDTAWNFKNKSATSFSRLLDKDARFRLFYSFRNGVFLDVRQLHGNKVLIFINMAVYMSILFFVSLFKVRFKEFRLIATAMRDGVAGKFDRKINDDAA